MDTTRVLAIDPFYRGFGYVVLEGPEALIDWGVAHAACDKNVKSLRQIARLVRRYEPDVIAAEDCDAQGSRRCQRVRELMRQVRKLAARRNIQIRALSRKHIRQAFAPSYTKHKTAQAVAACLPELTPHLPPLRKCWMSEDRRMTIFDAAAFALAFFHHSERATAAAR